MHPSNEAAALARVDKALADLGGRTLISRDEVENTLLDIRLAMSQTIEAEAPPAYTAP